MDELQLRNFQFLAILLAFVTAWVIAVKSPGLKDQPLLVRHFVGIICGVVSFFDLVVSFASLDWVIGAFFGGLSFVLLVAQYPALLPFKPSGQYRTLADLQAEIGSLPKTAKQEHLPSPVAQNPEPTMTYVRPWRPKPNPAPVQLAREAKRRSPRNSAESKPAKPGPTKGQFGTWIFTYCDSKGEISDRQVRVSSTDPEHLSGICSHGYRTFRLDHIQSEMVNTSTGEIIPPSDFFTSLCAGI